MKGFRQRVNKRINERRLNRERELPARMASSGSASRRRDLPSPLEPRPAIVALLQRATSANERLDEASSAPTTSVLSRSPAESLVDYNPPSTTRVDLPGDPGYPSQRLGQRPLALEYRGLSEERLEIRLLNIDTFNEQQSINDTKLRCSLKTVSLLDRPVYEALSYCWGSTEDRKACVILDGRERNISHNLMEALVQLRSEHENAPCLLWVDSICIDQGNKVEKARQVLLMNRIFARASKVYGWLGPASPQAPLVIEILRDLASSGSLGMKLSQGTQKLLEHVFLPLSHNPYWRRVWIIQELATAETLVMMWGPHKIPWSMFSAASETPDFRRIFQRNNVEALKALRIFRSQEQSILRTSRRIPLLDALIKGRYSLATEPRDKIYALINMTSDGRDVHPFPNYTQGMDAIVHDIGTAIIARQQKVAAILLASRSGGNGRNLPSWMPDWSALDVDLPPWLFKAVAESSGSAGSQEISVHAGALNVSCCFIRPIIRVFPEAFGRILGTNATQTDPKLSDTEQKLFAVAHAALFGHPSRSIRDVFDVLSATSADFKGLWTETDIKAFIEDNYDRMITMMKRAARQPTTNLPEDESLVETIRRWSRAGMQLAYTMSNGSKTFCVVCCEAAKADQICFLPHCALPVVLRRRDDHWTLIGEALLWFDRPKADVEWENSVDTRRQITIK